MSAKMLGILTLIAGLAAFGAYLLAFRHPSTTAPASKAAMVEGERFIPALADRGGEAAKIEISSKDETVTLTLDGDAWRVESKGGYPADPAKVRGLVTSLSELRTIEAKTALPERYPLISVQWPDNGEPGSQEFSARPTLVRVMDPKDVVIAEVVLGESSYTGGVTRQYARLLDQSQSWLVSARVDTPTAGMRWLDAKFIQLPRDSVKRVTITHATGETVTLSRPDKDADFAVESIPENMSQVAEGPRNRVGSALAFVNFSDVRKAEGGQTDPVKAVFETFDGLTVTVLSVPDNDGAWVRASAEGTGADELNAGLAGFEFRLPKSAVESLTRLPSDLLTENAPATPAAPGPEAPDTSVPELLRPPAGGGGGG
ncbi:MAG: DUF4340 domain-containing protein [Phycisphaeraceae bacterium]|nr:MAG: DUF4340 domain-containing protein [Phycisphaeraceae bacterium]